MTPGPNRPPRRKDMLGLRGVSKEEISYILDTAAQIRGINNRRVKKVPTLRDEL